MILRAFLLALLLCGWTHGNAPAVLSSPFASTFGDPTNTGQAFATTTVPTGTAYFVVQSLSCSLTAAQIKGGVDCNSVPLSPPNGASSGVNLTVNGGNFYQTFSPLNSGTTWYVSMVQNSSGGDSNVVTATFATE